MIILVGFIETIIIFSIGILLGVVLAYELFEYDLVKQLIRYEQGKMRNESTDDGEEVTISNTELPRYIMKGDS